MKTKSIFKTILIILSIIILFTVSCKKTDGIANDSMGGTAKIIMPWGQLAFSLNPFLTPGNRLGIVAQIYETLMYMSTDGTNTPILGVSYKWENNNHDLIFNLRKGVRWNDGTLFTSKDIVYTFNAIKNNKALDLYGIWDSSQGLDGVEALDNYTVTFKYKIINTPHVGFLTNIFIVPEHIWSKIDDPANYLNENPVGTGPFLFDKFTKENNVIYGKKNPNYWDMGKPYIDGIEIHSVKDNNVCLLSLLKGQADWSWVFIQDVEDLWHNKDPKHNKYFHAVVNSNIWYLNNQKPPLNIPAFRKALGMAVDKELMSDNVYSGVGAAHSTGLPANQQKEWIPKKLTNKPYTYDPKKALELLNSIGYTKKKNVLYDQDDDPVRTFRILVGSGWNDYIGLAQIIVDNLKKIGITAVIDQQPWSSYYPSFLTGTYDTGISWGQGLQETRVGPSPYYVFSKSLGKIKNEGNLNFSRYENAGVLEALEKYKNSVDPKVQKKAIETIIENMLKDVPYIPLTNRTSLNLFSERNFVNWPSLENPYANGAPDTQGSAIVLSNIHLR